MKYSIRNINLYIRDENRIDMSDCGIRADGWYYYHALHDSSAKQYPLMWFIDKYYEPLIQISL